MQNDLLAEIVECLPDPVFVVRAEEDSVRRVVLANAAAREIFRHPDPHPLLAQVVRRPEVLDIVEDALIKGETGEAIYDPGNSQERYLRAVARPLANDPDGAKRVLLTIKDETDARRNERMRADFLANASHELRTPLASLSGYIETLRGHARDDTAARERFLGVMAAQAERMSRLIADLMSLSRIELNEHIPPSGGLDLAAAARDVADSLAPILAAAGVSIEVTSEPTPMTGDRDQVMQVALNLIENAIKYSPRGTAVKVEVTIGSSPAPQDPEATYRSLLDPDAVANGGRWACLRVTDAGPGMAREILPRLTERFYRAPGQKSGETSGTGLGLAIVKHIVNRHAGGLFVESAPERGASFVAYFPTR
jgi:two-component system phosphate regulon sensor histidine kinase PhoR